MDFLKIVFSPKIFKLPLLLNYGSRCFLHRYVFFVIFFPPILRFAASCVSVHASGVPAQHPLLAPLEQRGSGRWLQPAGSRGTARAELSATPVLH